MACASAVEEGFEVYLTALKNEFKMFVDGGNRKVERFIINEFLNRYVCSGNLIELAELVFAMEDAELFELVMQIENAAFEHFEYSALELGEKIPLEILMARKWISKMYRLRYNDFDSEDDGCDDVDYSDTNTCYLQEKHASVIKLLCAGRKVIEEEGSEDVYFSGWV